MAKYIIAGLSNFNDPLFCQVAKELTAKGIDFVVCRDEDREAAVALVKGEIEKRQTGQTVTTTKDLDVLIDFLVDLDPYKK